jgi:hypothetical protein
MHSEAKLSRRGLIGKSLGVVALCLTPRAWGGEGFWNKKDPAAWTTEEIFELTSNSPWAREIRLDLKAKGGAKGEDSVNAVRDPTTGEFRGGSGTNGGQKGEKPPSAVVTWESALPLFDAMKYRLPADFIGHYVIGVKNLPILVDAGPQRQSAEQLVDWLKNSATLSAKSKDPVQAGVVATSRGGSMVLFGFLKELLPLSEKDKEVVFALNTNQLALKAKFEPKEMMYQGKLAL